ncbi:MAG: hypothetical protein R2852_08045 [Bacteroidia bacterium]
MDLKKLLNDIKPHAIVLLVFFCVGFIYFNKTFKGYSHKEDDVTQGLLKGTELNKYTDESGEFPGWTNSIFSGMPSTMIKGKVSGNQIRDYNYLTPFNNTAYPFKILFMSFIGFYLLMMAFKVKPMYGALAAIAYGFATYSISSVEAAHYTKVLAMGLMPAILASLHWLFSGRYFLGGITLAFNMALQIYFFHYQITFYTIICLLIMGIYYLINLIQENKVRQLLIATLISIFAVGAGVVSNITKIKTTSSFAENTMRGGNDMAKVDDSVKQKETGKTGLNRDYAFDWSYGKGETFTLLIPNFYGGSSREKLTTKSKFFEVTNNEEAIEQGLPMYHGDLKFTSGPIYIGSIIIFLFVLGMIVVKNNIKWAFLALTLVSFILGWGKHFPVINNFLFDHLPYFNKFRTPMMAFCIAQVTIPLIGFLGVKQLYETWKTGQTTPKNNKNEMESKTITKHKDEWIWNNVKLSYYIVGGFCLLMAIAGPSIVDMGGVVDQELRSGGNGNLITVLKEDRGTLLQKDAFRSFVYISLAFGVFWAWYTRKTSRLIAVVCIGVFASVDLISVDWRYLSWDDFTFEKGTVTDREPDQADLQILSDKSLHYRVFDLTNDPFNDNEGAAFHKMIGGYDPAKLSRYQDIISELLAQNDQRDKGLDMLNCKYIIGLDSLRRKGVIPRTTMNGNAWFVSELVGKDNAVAEMQELKQIDPKFVATFNSDTLENKSNIGLKTASFHVDSSASAELLSYHPDTLVYQVNNDHEGYLVFSEIWYDNWHVEIDGKPVRLNKVDYTLRGVSTPKGSHKVKMYFDKGVNSTDYIEKIVSISILIGMVLLIGIWLRSYFQKEA